MADPSKIVGGFNIINHTLQLRRNISCPFQGGMAGMEGSGGEIEEEEARIDKLP